MSSNEGTRANCLQIIYLSKKNPAIDGALLAATTSPSRSDIRVGCNFLEGHVLLLQLPLAD